jgi:hypothetical protein
LRSIIVFLAGSKAGYSGSNHGGCE